MKKNNFSRRRFISTSALLTAGLGLSNTKVFGMPAYIKSLNKSSSLINGVQLGLITYSFRSLKDQSAEATLEYILACGVNAVELMGGPAESFTGAPENKIDRRVYYRLMRAKKANKLTKDQKKEITDLEAQVASYKKELQLWRSTVDMGKFETLRKMYNDAGVSIYAFKPRAFQIDSSDIDINWGMKAAKALGASHVTLEHPSNDAHTLKLGKMAEKNGVSVGYHGHEQQTPTFWDTALDQSQSNAVNLDIGHYTAAGYDPVALVKEKHNRIKSIHIKDRQNPTNGKRNLVWGTGDTPLAETLQLMRDQKYTFPATVEYEYRTPEGSDAISEIKKCVAYCKSALNA